MGDYAAFMSCFSFAVAASSLREIWSRSSVSRSWSKFLAAVSIRSSIRWTHLEVSGIPSNLSTDSKIRVGISSFAPKSQGLAIAPWPVTMFSTFRIVLCWKGMSATLNCLHRSSWKVLRIYLTRYTSCILNVGSVVARCTHELSNDGANLPII